MKTGIFFIIFLFASCKTIKPGYIVTDTLRIYTDTSGIRLLKDSSINTDTIRFKVTRITTKAKKNWGDNRLNVSGIEWVILAALFVGLYFLKK